MTAHDCIESRSDLRGGVIVRFQNNFCPDCGRPLREWASDVVESPAVQATDIINERLNDGR